MKSCSDCGVEKPLGEFHKKVSNNDGLDYNCKLCANRKIRERRHNKNNLDIKVYEKTIKGKLVRTYRNMTSRVKGILKNKRHLYLGLDILEKEIFYEWSLNNVDYNRLFNDWVLSGYEIKLSPSIDRKDASKGYLLDNIRWVTFEFNSLNTRTRKNQYSV